MAQKLLGVIPDALDLDANYVIEFTAVDAATGADVTSVVISNVSLLVANVKGGDLGVGFDLGNIEWLHIPDNLSASAPEGG